VLDVVAPRDQDLLRALTENRRSALQAALLQLPDSFTFEELFMKIASISYTGDFRVYVAEVCSSRACSV
jgi:translocator assembly and maintenance protein 41